MRSRGSRAHFGGRQAQLLDVRRVILCHHDDWLPGFSVDTDLGPIKEELARTAPGAELLELGYVDETPILG